jgi:hypothetical protein
MDALQGEALAAALLGKIDAFEISAFREEQPEALTDWYQLLGCGLRLPLAGGSGKDSNATAVGAMRTYAKVPAGEELTYGGWVDAVRKGISFITNGPLLALDVEGQGPGHQFTALPDGRPLRIKAEAKSVVPFDLLEVLYNGEVVAERDAFGNRQSALLEVGYRPTQPGWLAVRCRGRERLADGQLPFAHTSPVWIHAQGQPPQLNKTAAERFLKILDRTLDWTVSSANCNDPKAREHLQSILGEARRKLTE